MKRRFLIMILLSAGLSNGYTQSLKDTVKLAEVLVNAGRLLPEKALYIHKMDSNVLINSINANLSDVLQKNSSVYIKSYGSGGLATASFRGTSASHTQILWNGMNINPPMWGQVDLSLLPVFFSDEIDLYYGSSSLSKTSGGIGGCITLNNTPRWNTGFSASLSQTLASFSSYITQLKITQSTSRLIVRTRLYIDKAKNNFLYYNNLNPPFGYTRQDNADYLKDGILQEVYYKLKDRQFLGLKLLYIRSDRNLPPIMSYRGNENGTSRTENQKDKNLNIIGEWKSYTAVSTFTLNTGLLYNDLKYMLANANQGGEVISFDSESQSFTFSGKMNYQHNFSDQTILKSSFDANTSLARYSDKMEASGYDKGQSDLTSQISVHHAFGNRISAYLLFQEKVLNSRFMPFLPAMGLEIDLIKDRSLKLRSNLGRNLHVPNLNDKYFVPGGNSLLKPEVGIQGDLGLQYRKQTQNLDFQWELTGYSAWIDNWILWHPSEYRYWMADNVQSVFSRGIECTTNMEGILGDWKYQLKADYGFTRTTNQQKDAPSYGMQLIYIPIHLANLNVFTEKGKFSCLASFHFTGSRSTSTQENLLFYRLPPYYLIDLGLGRKFHFKSNMLEFGFRCNNILDKQYQAILQRAMPGRNFSLTIRYVFSNVQIIQKF